MLMYVSVCMSTIHKPSIEIDYDIDIPCSDWPVAGLVQSSCNGHTENKESQTPQETHDGVQHPQATQSGKKKNV